MDYLLEGIPEELWERLKIAASARGKSERSFLLDAAFNEIERTGSILPSQEKYRPRQGSTPNHKAPVEGETKFMRNLRTVGIGTLIDYYEVLKENNNRQAHEILRENEGYSYHSANTKVSIGKGIIRNREALLFCLKHIAHKSERITPERRAKALRILKDLT